MAPTEVNFVALRDVLFLPAVLAAVATADGVGPYLPQVARTALYRGACGTIAVLVAAQTAGVLLYLAYPIYLDHLEPTVAVISWLGWRGHAIYPHLGDPSQPPDLIGMLYGPALFLFDGVVLALVGPSIAASKLVGVVPFLAAQVCTFVALRRSGVRTGLAMLLTAGQFFLLLSTYPPDPPTFWARADAMLILIQAVALLVALRPPSVATALCLGAMAGLATGFKAHGVLYVAPLLVLVLLNPRRRAPVLALLAAFGVGGLALALLPFAWPTVSMPDYLTYLRLATNHGFLPVLVHQNLLFTVALWTPHAVLLAWTRVRLPRDIWACFATLLSSMLIVAVIAAKDGAGFIHMMPFLPSVMWLLGIVVARCDPIDPVSATTDRRRAVTRAAAVGLVCATLPFAAFSWRELNLRFSGAWTRGEPVIAEIQQFMRNNPGLRVAIGPGADRGYALTFLRVLPVFAGNPLPIDPGAWMDLQYSGVDPMAVRRALLPCRVDVWLIPTMEPFTMRSLYTNQPLFSPYAVFTFHAAYAPDPPGQYFQAWRCIDRTP